MAETLMERGFALVSGGTDNHLMLLDFSERPYSGKDAEEALGKAGITVNKNTVPNEKRSPFITSGVRIGSPAMTTRGMGKAEARQIALWITEALEGWQNPEALASVRQRVQALTASFPVPGL